MVTDPWSQSIDPNFVQELLGHFYTSLTINVYPHVLPDVADAGAGARDAALGYSGDVEVK